MLSTATAEGKIVTHPMGVQEVQDDATSWFFISVSGDQATAIADNPKVNIAFSKTGDWLSVSGTAEFVQGTARDSKLDELWNEDAKVYFDQGKDDPDLGLLKVTGDSAQYWGVPGNKAVAAMKILGAKATNSETPGGTATTEL